MTFTKKYSIAWGRTLLLGVSALAMASVMSMTGANEAKAVCGPGNIEVGPECVANGNSLNLFNIAIGAINGSGNANTVVGTGTETNVQIGNVWLGAANGSGNGNSVFDPTNNGDATNIAVGNFEVGLANGAGNANIVFNALGNDATNVEVLNEFFGIGNGSLNGNEILGNGSATNVEVLNAAHGIGNLSGNGNVVGSCRADGSAIDTNTEVDTGQSIGGNPIICKKTGDALSVAVNNTAFGNLNGSGNGNAFTGSATSILVDNTLFGNANAFGNGNGNSGNSLIAENFMAGNFNGSLNGNTLDSGANSNNDANATLTDNRVIGNESASNNGNGGTQGTATLNNNTVIGNGSVTDNGNNVVPVLDANGDPIPGEFTGTGGADLENNTVIGDRSLSNNAVPGDGTFNANNNTIIGSDSANNVGDDFNNNTIIGNNSGNNASTDVQNNVVMGNNAGNNITGDNNVAIGENAGNGLGNQDTAIGNNATVTADHSTALGADAVATQDHQMVFGTQSDTYTAPGITSNLSRSRQSGPLEVVTSDAGGNLATDGGAVFHQLNNLDNDVAKARSGIALAIAMAGPDLTGNERFGMSANWGNFDGANGFGMGFEGVVANDLLITGGRFAITGGFGVGFVDNGHNDTFGNSFGSSSSDNVWGGRVGGQWTWGHKAVAYAVPPESAPLK